MLSHRTPTLAALLAVSTLALACGSKQPSMDIKASLSGPYLGQQPPGAEAELFAPGLVCTGLYERDAAFTADGTEFYYTAILGTRATIVRVRQVDGVWGEPEVAPFSGAYSDYEPFISPDGSTFLFISHRPLEPGGEIQDNSDVWVMDRVGDEWSEPRNLGEPISSAAKEYFPAVTADGTLYFTRRAEDGEKLMRSELVDGVYQEPEPLPREVNGQRAQFNGFVAPDESYLIFGTLTPESGGTDYFISFRREDGSWTPAMNMGDTVNSPAGEWAPYVTRDGRYMFFHSTRGSIPTHSDPPLGYADLARMAGEPRNGQGDIYWVDASFIEELRRTALT